MVDLIKEMFDAFRQRLTSPIIGSTIFAFIVVNWQSIYYVAFSGKSAERKFKFWDAHTSFLEILIYPALIGIAFSVARHWLELGNDYISKIPMKKRHQLKAQVAIDMEQFKKDHQLKVQKEAFDKEQFNFDLQEKRAEREQDRVDQEIALQEKLKEIEDDEERKEIKKSIDNDRILAAGIDVGTGVFRTHIGRHMKTPLKGDSSVPYEETSFVEDEQQKDKPK